MKLIGKVILSLCIILFSFSVSQAEIAVYDANNQFIGYLLGSDTKVDYSPSTLQVYVPSVYKIINLSSYYDYDHHPDKLGIVGGEGLYYQTSNCVGTPYILPNTDNFYNYFYIFPASGKYYTVDSATLTDKTICSLWSNYACHTLFCYTPEVLPVREVFLPFILPLIQPLKFSIETPTNKKLFQWPVDPNNTSNGHYGPCPEWAGDPAGCYWLGDSEDINVVWRDVQPFQLHDWGSRGYHLGADFNLGNGAYDKGKLVYPVTNGIISKVKSNQCGYGNIIFVRHNTSFGVYTSMYAHVDWLEGVPPQEGSSVTTDKPIAKVGNGYWNNPNCSNQIGQWPYHLHFEIREGDNTVNGPAYTKYKVDKGPQGQIDPNAFISTHN